MKLKYKIINKYVPPIITFWGLRFVDSEFRPMFKYIEQNSNNKYLTGVEIGVWRGTNAVSILNHINIKKLFLVDPYIINKEYEPSWLPECTQSDISNDFKIASNKLNSFKDKITFIISPSEEAVKDIPDNLDFVYIDGNHSYDFVKKDIELFYPKVCIGGVFGGHDYSPKFLGVVRAVDDFVYKHSLFLNREKIDWWVVKKEKGKSKSKTI